MTTKDLDQKPDTHTKTPSTMPDSTQATVSFSTAALASIPKLTIGNLYAWKTSLKMYLKMTGLYEFIETMPTRPDDTTERARFDMREAAALYAIHNTIDSSNQSSIASIDNPKLAFDTLTSQHGSDGGVITANTLSELFSSRYDSSIGITKYLSTIQDLHSKIRDLTAGDKDLQLSDWLFAILLVNSLPRSEFGQIIQHFLSNIDTISTAQVCARLRLEATTNASESKSSNVYTARTGKTDNRRVGKYPKDLCNVHPNPRHTNEECSTQKKNNQPSSTTDTSKSTSKNSTEEKARRYEAMMASSQSHLPQQTAKAHAAIEETPQKEEYITYSAFSASTHQPSSDHFLADTGANTHIACDSSLLHDICPITPVNINGLAGTSGQVTASFKGTETINGHTTDGHPRTIEVKNVLLAPKAGVNLLAVSVMTKEGARFSGDDLHIKLENPSKNYTITGQGANGLYKVWAFKATSHFTAAASIPTDVWHRRYGHLNYRSLNKVSPTSCRSNNCEACILSKAHRLPFSSHLPMSDTPLF